MGQAAAEEAAQKRSSNIKHILLRRMKKGEWGGSGGVVAGNRCLPLKLKRLIEAAVAPRKPFVAFAIAVFCGCNIAGN